VKQIILLFLLFPLFSKSQDCVNLLVKSTDKFTKKTTVSLKYTIEKISKNGNILFLMNLNKDEEGVIVLSINIKDKGFGCIDEYSKIYFLFSDSTSDMILNNNKFNCNGLALSFINRYFSGNEKLGTMFSEKIITDIKVEGVNGSYEISLNKEKAEKFRRSATCMFKSS